MTFSIFKDKLLKLLTEFDYRRRFICLTQMVFYLPSLFLRYVVVRGDVRCSLILHAPTKMKTRYVMYANHQSVLDPFIICACLPYRIFLTLLPIRFFTANKYLANPLLGIFFRTLGCFPAYFINNRLYGLDKAKSILEKNQTAFIFPTGMRTRENFAKSGISVLARAPNVCLIPVYINWKNRLSCQVRIGSAFTCDKPAIPKQIMEVVYALEEKRGGN